MQDYQTALVHESAGVRLASRPARPRRTTPRILFGDRWLALTAVFYTLLLMALGALGRDFAWDESVYFSQVDPRAPAAFFGAPRSRGVTLLGLPVTLLTSRPAAVHVFIAVLAGCALFVSFSVWRQIIGERTTALAAGLFGTLWVSVDYGPQVMPDLWVAFAAVAAVGLFLRIARDGANRGRVAGLAGAVAWAALTRSNDGVLIAVPLLAATVAVRTTRRWILLAAVSGGLAAGLAEWVAEAYVRFGGVGERLADSGRIEGGMRLMWNVDNVLRSANGPILCRPCTVGSGPALLDLWWLGIPLLTAIALTVAARGGRDRLATAVVPLVCALSLAVPYLFLIPYSAPRFLLPAYALLALPIAAALTRGASIVRARPTPLRVSAAVLVSGLLAAHVTLQLLVAHYQADLAVRKNHQYTAAAGALRRRGIRPPCLLGGKAVPVAYDAGCSSSLASRPWTDTSGPSGTELLRAARHERAALLLVPGEREPGYALGWRCRPLAGSSTLRGWTACLPPHR